MRRCPPVIAVIVSRLSSAIRCLRLPVGAAVVVVLAMINTAAPASAAAPKPAKLLISPMSHLYGSTLVGAVSAGQSYALTNSGLTTAGPVSVALTGADAGDFVVDANSCTATLAAGTSCSVIVHFAPTAVGARTSNLSVTATPGGRVTSSLKGTAVPGPTDDQPNVAPVRLGRGRRQFGPADLHGDEHRRGAIRPGVTGDQRNERH